MANYTKKFQKPYTNGYKDRPDTSTPVTADIKNAETDALLAIEEYLANNAISSVSANIGNSTGVYIATIRINDVDYRIYTPMVRYTSEISEGTKVGTLTFGTYSFDVYAPAASAGGSSVSIMPKTTEGTNIAEITVDGTTYQLYAPTGGGGSGSTVTAEATLTEGTQIGKITIDGTEIILYAPTASEIAVDTELSATSENAVQNKVVTSELNKKIETLDDESQAPDAVNFDLDSELSLTSVKGVQNKVIAEEFQRYANGTKVVAKATEAETATKATQDAQGNVIDTTYAKKTEIPQGAVVDDSLSSTSVNPVQNKVVKAEFDQVNSNLSNLKDGTTPVAKAVADEDGNNIKSTYAKKTETSETVTEDVNVVLNSDLFDSTYSDITCVRIGKLCVLSFTIRAKNTISSTIDKIVLMSIVGKKYQPKKLSASSGRKQIFQGFAVGNYDENGKQSQSLNNTVRIITDWDSNYTEIITRDKDRLNWNGYVQGQIMWVTD